MDWLHCSGSNVNRDFMRNFLPKSKKTFEFIGAGTVGDGSQTIGPAGKESGGLGSPAGDNNSEKNVAPRKDADVISVADDHVETDDDLSLIHI